MSLILFLIFSVTSIKALALVMYPSSPRDLIAAQDAAIFPPEMQIKYMKLKVVREISRVTRRPVFKVSDKFRHKPSSRLGFLHKHKAVLVTQLSFHLLSTL